MFKLYIGNEPYLSLREALRFVSELRKTEHIEYLSIDAEKVDIAVLIDTLSSQSLFTSQRLILLKRPYRNKNKESLISFLLEYLPNGTTDTIIIWEDQKVSSVTKYVKFFKAEKQLEEYNKLNKRTFITWAQKEVETIQVQLERSALQLLGEYSNYNPERFVNNVKKLKLLEKDSFTKDDVIEFAPDTLESDIWYLLDQINNNSKNTLLVLEKIMKQGVDSNYIISMIARNIRLVTMVKDLKNKGVSSREMASVLRVPPFTLPSLSQASDRYTMEKLKYIYEKMCSLDYEIKVGRIAPEVGLTVLCTIL